VDYLKDEQYYIDQYDLLTIKTKNFTKSIHVRNQW